MLVCTLGDLLLDVIVRLNRPLARGDDVPARSLAAPGGQAANVAAWAAALGARARFVGKRGDDEAGRIAAAGLAARGVELAGPPAAGRNGVVVSLVEPDGERTLASDRGVAATLAADELDPAWLDGCDWLHVAGYGLLAAPMAAAAARAASAAHAAGARVSVDLSSRVAIDALGAESFRDRLAPLEPDLVFGTEGEHEAIGRLAVARVVKRGAAGFEDGDGTWAPEPGEVVDTTGAGDALAAGYLVGGAALAAEAARRCVAQPGAMP